MRGSPFFEGVGQADVVIGGQSGKLPAFYYDAASMTALFPAHLAALRAMMPDPQYVPARLAPAVGVVAITCLEYRDCDIGPYNELAICVPLTSPGEANLPGRALVDSRRSGRVHLYVHHLPVTTDVALRGGVDFYNYPKFIGQIEFRDEDDRRSCRLAEGREHILTLTGRRIAATQTATVRNFMHLWMDGRPQSTEFRVHQHAVGGIWGAGAASLELGDEHPIARELERLLLSRRPLRYEYVPSFEGILFGPDRLGPALLATMIDALAPGREPAVAR